MFKNSKKNYFKKKIFSIDPGGVIPTYSGVNNFLIKEIGIKPKGIFKPSNIFIGLNIG